MPIEGEHAAADAGERASSRARRWVPWILALAVALHLPSLRWGFFADDHGHELALDGRIPQSTMRPWALYDFGRLADQPELRDQFGAFPYWTDARWKARFLRPLASLERWLEHSLLRGSALGAHIAGLCWWALLLFAAWRLYVLLGLSPPAACLALALFGFENGHVVTIGWAANRNSVLEALFVVLAVSAFVRSSKSGSGTGVALAFAYALLAVGAKESGVAAFALIAAWSFLGRRAAASPAFERGRRTWAALGIAAAALYLALYVGLGYGTQCVFYATPWGQPAVWLRRVVALVPGAAMASVTPLATDIVNAQPGSWPLVWIVGALVWLLLVPRLVPSARAHPAGPFLAAWIALTLLPQGGAPLSDRLFLVPSLAWCALFGIFLEATRLRAQHGWARRGERLARGFVLVFGLVLSPLVALSTGFQMGAFARLSNAVVANAQVGTAADGPRDAFVLQAPSGMVSLQPGAVWQDLGGDEALTFWTLSGTRRGVRWTRTAERTFELETLDDPFFHSLFEQVFLSHPPAAVPGTTWRTDRFTVEALAVLDGYPTRLRVTLDRSLDDPSAIFLVWQPDPEGVVQHPDAHGVWARVTPPAIGETLEFPSPPAPLRYLP